MIFQDKGDRVCFDLTEIPKPDWLTLEPGYSLPAGVIRRAYSPEYHTLWGAQGEQSGVHPWADGDRYLANAQTYITAYRRSQGEIIPDLGAFRVAMLSDPGYNRIAAVAPAHLIAGLTGAIVVSPIHYPSVVLIWNAIVLSLPDELSPTPAEVAAWQSFTVANQIPLVFGEGGFLALV